MPSYVVVDELVSTSRTTRPNCLTSLSSLVSRLSSLVSRLTSLPLAQAYTNIRLESSTPEGLLNHGGGGVPTYPSDPSMPDTPDLLASTGQAPSNPFTTVDLSTFSQDDLEARRDLLLSILAQTNNELGVPPMPRAAEATPEEAVADAESEESKESKESKESVTEATEATVSNEANEAGDDAPADTVIETEEAAPEKDTRSADADSSADQASSSFFKNLMGGSKAPRSSAQTATLSIAAAVLTVLTVV